MINYQGWNLLLCVLSHEKLKITSGHDLFDLAMIIHHGLSFIFAICLLEPFAHSFCIFYFGIVELTNIPLTVMDVFKYFKHWKEKYPQANQATRIVFAISFIFLRLILWPIRSYAFFEGCLKLLWTGEAHSSPAVLFCFISALIVTYLQFLWGSKIFSTVLVRKDSKSEKSDWNTAFVFVLLVVVK